jgi:hypothetical protein
MSAVYCDSCNLANSRSAEVCHFCSAKLNTRPQGTAGTISNGDEAGYAAVERKQYAWLATKALISATILSFVRATIIPYLITKSPPGTLGQMDAQTVEMMGFFMAAVFGAAAFYAMQRPLISVAIAMTLYLTVSIPDFLQGHGILGRGVISKGVMMLVLTRALIAGMQHQLLKD